MMSDYMHKEYKLPNGRTVTADFNELGCVMVTIQAMDALFDILNSSEQQWTPCSERLPEEGKDVLLTYKNNMVVGNWEDICGDVTWYANSGDGWFTATESVDNDGIPIAWMPLPEPWKGEES